MTTPTPLIDRAVSRITPGARPLRPARCHAATDRQRGFTLSEVIIATTLSGFVLVGVLSAFLMLGRSGFLAGAYSEMDGEIRRGLEVFGEDVRKANGVHWNDAQSITLSVVLAGGNVGAVTYGYDADPTSRTYRCFYRVVGDTTSTLPRLALVHGVGSDLAFHRFKLVQPGVVDNAATTDLETKQLQVTLRASRSGVTTALASQSAVSAAYTMRNKRVTN